MADYVTREELLSAISECAQSIAITLPTMVRGMNANNLNATSAHLARHAISAQDHDMEFAEFFTTQMLIAIENNWEEFWASREFIPKTE